MHIVGVIESTICYRERKIDWDAEEQKDLARASGVKNADKVNLQPFIGGATDKTKIGGKK